jgi:outer membrane protein assembly factor BamB
MTQLESDASVIELGVLGAEVPVRGRELPVHLRRRVVVAVLTLLCLLALASSAPGQPVLGEPLWTGGVSLNGFTVGADGLYEWRLDGKAVVALDLSTGRPRWSRDITELPDSVTDLGNGVAIVATRRLTSIGAGWNGFTLTLVRDATGERIAQVVGDSYLPSADGQVLIVSSRRYDNPDACGASDVNCVDLTAWDVHTGAVAWKINLAPNAQVLPSFVDGRIEALAEIGTDGTVQLRDVTTGAVVGSARLPPEVELPDGPMALAHGALVTAWRGPEGITVAGYQRPSLNRSWSLTVPDHTPITDRGGGEIYLGDCAPDVCMMVGDAGFWVINESTGSVSKPIDFQVFARLGGGVFLATPMHEPFPDATAGRASGVIVDRDGRILARLGPAGPVDWTDSGGRVLVTREGPARTDFRVIDGRGSVRTLGGVPGTGLTCHARGDILACSEPTGRLRVWRLPA